jgi:hypothetical protein
MQGQSGTHGQSGTQGQSGMQGQSGTLSQSGTADQLSGNQITGRVVKSERKTIWVEHAGAVVPLKIDKNTQFTDPNLKRAADIKEGDQIRASFEVRKTDNVATSIGMSSDMGQGGAGSGSDVLTPGQGQGGSGSTGSDVLTPDQGINGPVDSLPPSGEGAGGSGSDTLGGDINEGSSPDSGLGSDDMSSGQNKTGDY